MKEMDDIGNKMLGCFKINVDLEGIRFIEKTISDLEKENRQLKEATKLLRKEIKIHSKKSNDRYKAIKSLEHQLWKKENKIAELKSQLHQWGLDIQELPEFDIDWMEQL